jgi:hypothetical protein
MSCTSGRYGELACEVIFKNKNFRDEGKLAKILGFHGGDYEECSLLGCGSV